MMAQLKHSGYRTLWARAGLQGIDLAQDIQPELVLLDILLPDIDGWEVLKQLKDSVKTASIPVILVSILADAQKGRRLGATDTLEKPFKRELLLHKVRHALSGIIETHD